MITNFDPRNQQRGAQRNQSGPSPNRLLVRVVGVFTLLLGAYYAFATTELYEDRVFEPYLLFNLKASRELLIALGESVDTQGVLLYSSAFGVSVARGCDGIGPMMLFLAALFAFPTRWVLRLPALLICLPLLAAINVIRIVSLFLLGSYRPELFDVMHTDIWQVLYIGIALVLFSFWLVWATRTPARAQH